MTNFFEQDINQLVDVLNQGGLIIFPTDTIWGIGCDATNASAVKKVFQIKDRPIGKPFVLLVENLEELKKYVHQVHPKIETLLLYHTRPLTVVYEKATNLPQETIANDGSVAVRIPLDDFCIELLSRFGKPIVATSANLSTQPFPANFNEIDKELLEKVDFVASYRRNETTPCEPSVMIKLDDKEEILFLRD